MAEGVELANHWTHSAPCSPSRATMMTGRYLPGHEVYDNTVFPWHHSLDPAIPTVGSVMGAAGYRSSYIGKWHLTGGPDPADGPVRLRRLGRQRPALHGLGGHRRALRSRDRRLRRPLARRQRRPGRPVVPHRRAGQPARRDVVPDGPARLPGGQPRGAGRHRGAPRRWRSGRTARPSPPFTEPYDDVVDGAPRQLRRRPAHQARLPPPVALGPAALDRRLHRPRRTASRGVASSTTTCGSTSSPTSRSARCSPPSRPAAPGTTPWSCSPPTTATCAARTACARRARSSTTRS